MHRTTFARTHRRTRHPALRLLGRGRWKIGWPGTGRPGAGRLAIGRMCLARPAVLGAQDAAAELGKQAAVRSAARSCAAQAACGATGAAGALADAGAAVLGADRVRRAAAQHWQQQPEVRGGGRRIAARAAVAATGGGTDVGGARLDGTVGVTSRSGAAAAGATGYLAWLIAGGAGFALLRRRSHGSRVSAGARRGAGAASCFAIIAFNTSPGLEM